MTFQVKKSDADEFLTFDLGASSVYYAPPACAYSFSREQADLLAAKHGGIVGTLETVWGNGLRSMKVISRTWTPADAKPELRPVP